MSIFKFIGEGLKKIIGTEENYPPPPHEILPGGMYGKEGYASPGEAIYATVTVVSHFYNTVFRKLSDEDKIKCLAWINNNLKYGEYLTIGITQIGEELSLKQSLTSDEIALTSLADALYFANENVKGYPVIKAQALFIETIGSKNYKLTEEEIKATNERHKNLLYEKHPDAHIEIQLDEDINDNIMKDGKNLAILIYDNNINKPKFECMTLRDIEEHFLSKGVDLNLWFYGAQEGIVYLKAIGDVQAPQVAQNWEKILTEIQNATPYDIDRWVDDIRKSGVKDKDIGINLNEKVVNLFYSNRLFSIVFMFIGYHLMQKEILKNKEVVETKVYPYLYEIKHPDVDLEKLKEVIEQKKNKYYKYYNDENYRLKFKGAYANICYSLYKEFHALQLIEQKNPQAMERLKKILPIFGEIYEDAKIASAQRNKMIAEMKKQQQQQQNDNNNNDNVIKIGKFINQKKKKRKILQEY